MQISDTVYPMYKAYIEPDLKTAHLKIYNTFNPFSGFMDPTYILKSAKRVSKEVIHSLLKVPLLLLSSLDIGSPSQHIIHAPTPPSPFRPPSSISQLLWRGEVCVFGGGGGERGGGVAQASSLNVAHY